MRLVRLTICVSLFSMSVAALGQDAGWDLMTKTRNDATFCVVSESVRLDDHSTSPEIIVRGAMRACQQSISAFDRAFRSKFEEMVPYDVNSQRESAISEKTNEFHVDMQELAIQAILEERVKKRAPNQ